MSMRKRYQIFFILFLFTALCAQKDSRDPVVAGQFYPADPTELAKDVQSRLQNAPAKMVDGHVLGLVVPHAGYQYSADIAAAGYKQVEGQQYDVIIILAPSHRDRFRGATIYPGSAYNTPLGSVPIDKKIAQELVNQSDQITFSEVGHRAEHSLEVQLPFVQTLLPNTPIVPMVIGFIDWSGCQSIAKALAKSLKQKNPLIIASTDLYHGESYNDCKKLNEQTLAAIVDLHPQKLFSGLASGTYQACGGYPVVIMESAAQQLGADAAMLLKRTNSNDVTGTKSGYVVGYGAVAVYQTGAKKISSDKIQFEKLDTENQIDFIKMAHTSIEYYLQHGTIPKFKAKNDVQNEKRGVFVTLTKDGYLRGCIGHHESNVPLYQLVPEMAVAAAFEDPRFPPLQADELDDIKIKVSVYLTNVYQIDSLDEFEMGRQGIIMRKGQRGATYLPEVPVEAGWTSVEQEMFSLCQKAGLPPDAWKNGAEFWVYETQVFDESILKK